MFTREMLLAFLIVCPLSSLYAMQVKQKTISNEEAQKILVAVRSTQMLARGSDTVAESESESKVGLTPMLSGRLNPMDEFDALLPDVPKAVAFLEKSWLDRGEMSAIKMILQMLFWYEKQTSHEKKEAFVLYVLSHYPQTVLTETIGIPHCLKSS